MEKTLHESSPNKGLTDYASTRHKSNSNPIITLWATSQRFLPDMKVVLSSANNNRNADIRKAHKSYIQNQKYLKKL